MSTAKVIVTNLAKLKEKYGAVKMKGVNQAVKALIKADAGRDLKTSLVDLSSAAQMNKFETTPVPGITGDESEEDKLAIDKAYKRAIDKVYKALEPGYLMLLGATDVIPHQDLDNPVPGDPDKFAESDLPYACDKSYSQDIRDFLIPTRVVGRLPDIRGSDDADYLIGVLATATKYKSRPATDYDTFLAITAEVWQESTKRSLRALFNTSEGMKVSPFDGPEWLDDDLKPLVHFINCHGARIDPKFYGEGSSSIPPAHDALVISGRITEGSVLAAECCYGAELFAPATPGDLGMCNSYLASKAYAYFGSSTIAFGPADENDLADLICQYFLKHVRLGASVGRACWQARLDYQKNKNPLLLGPTDYKTLAQFNLMADPALTPVQAATPALHVVPKGAKTKAAGTPSAIATAARFFRRATLSGFSKALVNTVYLTAAEVSKLSGAKNLNSMKILLQEAAKRGIKNPSIRSFAVEAPSLPKSLAASAEAEHIVAPKLVHCLVEKLPSPDSDGEIFHIKGIEAVQYDNGDMTMREFFSR